MSIKKFPFEIRPLEPELDEKIKSLYLGANEGSVEIGPKKYVISSKYGQVAETVYNFEVRPDDVWVVTFPRSGTTLMQEMTWLILNDDYDTAKNVSLFKRFPFLEQISTLIRFKMNINKFPFEIRPLEAELDDKIKSLFLGANEGCVEIGPKKYIISSKYGQAAETIYNFEVRPDDVWVVTFPRSGTTLMQEMAWLILNDDNDTAKNASLLKRFPFLELSTLCPDHVIAETTEHIVNDQKMWQEYKESMKPQWEVLENTVGRRFIKSHLPLSLLPPTLLTSGAKVVYIARNPKNAIISRYYQERSLRMTNYVGNFEQYWDLFEKNLMYFTPYWEHLEEAWQQRSNKNLSFFFFDDVIKDYKKAIVELSNFLEKTMSDEQISKLADYLHIDNFRGRPQVNFMLKIISVRDPYQHVRTGKSGVWDEYFTQELEARANKWIEENYKNTTLRFPIKLY
ncbi:estrogen sulfotransferase-like [Anoplophora glabripennis]|uniref:estrogen sulfotransferase-like n=1 Tax=Anoplophora glabripennis TaxID=217634 RepID=UPI000C76C8C0|nr:estrogen sulfotransferase-like [Anoplophora glabripennis]